MSHFLHHDDNDDAKAIAIPRVFSENSQAKNVTGWVYNIVGKMLVINIIVFSHHVYKSIGEAILL